MVGYLDHLFSHFDELAERYGLEKIKTIGDCYMVAAGVPTPRPDHARALALMALDMLEAMRSGDDVGHLGLELRVGINSGPVVAGVIGRKRFLYDLWGDAVNTASRMESHGTPGRIQITRATYELLADEFECEPRGTIAVKGKGELEAWYLIGPRGNGGTAADDAPTGPPRPDQACNPARRRSRLSISDASRSSPPAAAATTPSTRSGSDAMHTDSPAAGAGPRTAAGKADPRLAIGRAHRSSVAPLDHVVRVAAPAVSVRHFRLVGRIAAPAVGGMPTSTWAA